MRYEELASEELMLFLALQYTNFIRWISFRGFG